MTNRLCNKLTISISQLHCGLEDGNHDDCQHHHDVVHLWNVHGAQDLQRTFDPQYTRWRNSNTAESKETNLVNKKSC